MKRQPVILICGVPGSGKTHVAKKLPKHHFKYVPHDDYPRENYHKVLTLQSEISQKPVVGEAPFRVTELVEKLEDAGVPVEQYWIVEDEATTKKRYETREKKPIPKQHLKNRVRYDERTKGSKTRGTSDEVLFMLLSREGK